MPHEAAMIFIVPKPRVCHPERSEGSAAAIAREKQIKGWRRSKKVELIELNNPTWDDLADNWFD
jgi:putative endonuclease